MAKLDKFMEMMAQRKVSRAVLVNDKPFELIISGQKSEGTVTSGAQLTQTIEEITPVHLRHLLSQDCFFDFRHELPQGAFDVSVENFFGTFKVIIAPTEAESLNQSHPSTGPSVNTGQIPNSPKLQPAFSQPKCQKCGYLLDSNDQNCARCHVQEKPKYSDAEVKKAERNAAMIIGAAIGTFVGKYLGYLADVMVFHLPSPSFLSVGSALGIFFGCLVGAGIGYMMAANNDE